MTFSEIFLRVGCALVGWILLFAHGLVLAVVPLADCSPELWHSSSIFAGFALVAAGLLSAGLPWRASLRWVALPALGLVAWGLYVSSGLLPATFDGIPLCVARAGGAAPGVIGTASGWERAWAPLQIATLVACGGQSARYWRGR